MIGLFCYSLFILCDPIFRIADAMTFMIASLCTAIAVFDQHLKFLLGFLYASWQHHVGL
jgi:predicted Co/Zn/Cd cation transporter (cation efflux family)